MHAGSINIIGLEVSQFLPLYAAIAASRLDTNQLGNLHPIIIAFTNTNDVTRAEAVQLMDKVLYDQAGIVVTHPDSTQAVFKWRSAANEK